MPTPEELYTSSIYNKFSYLATWLPNTGIALGDVGVKQGPTFNRMSTASALGIKFGVRTGDHPLDFHYASESGVTLRSAGQGGVSDGAVGEARVEVEFSKSGGFLLRARDCRIDEIDDKVALGRRILAAHKRGAWQREWAVVDSVVRAGRTTILLCHSASAKLELAAATPTSTAALTALDGDFSLRAQSGEVTHLIGAEGLTPLFRLSRLKRSFLDKLLGRPLEFGGRAEGDDPEEMLEPVTPG